MQKKFHTKCLIGHIWKSEKYVSMLFFLKNISLILFSNWGVHHSSLTLNWVRFVFRCGCRRGWRTKRFPSSFLAATFIIGQISTASNFSRCNFHDWSISVLHLILRQFLFVSDLTRNSEIKTTRLTFARYPGTEEKPGI